MKKTIIIAEAGVNHNGDINSAKKLIDVAAEANVDYVKFQTFKAENLVSKKARMASYQKQNINATSDSQYEMLKSLELSHEDHVELCNYSESKGVKFFSTAFDVEGLEYLDQLGLELFKSPSGEITNYPYLKKLSELGKPVILSTGMADMDEIRQAVDVLISGEIRKEDITVLHCNTQYPTPMKDVNLKAMNSIANELGVAIGYSDHTLGIEVPIAAVALGATVIEKHFTLSRDLPGPDHKASLEPDELKLMVSAIRNIDQAISGDGIKRASPSEIDNKEVARKSIHTSRKIEAGEIINSNDLIALRPGNGISPMKWDMVIGKRSTKTLYAYHLLEEGDYI